jgi:hypothetical protein
MSERWLPVEGYDGAYEVSDLGRVRGIDRMRLGRNGFPQPHKGKVLKPASQTVGYQQVRLCRYGKKHTFYVHRVVMAAFIGPCPPGYEVDHLDNNPSNNALTNLRYVTPQENAAAKAERRTHFSCGHLLEGNTYKPRPGVRRCHRCERARWRRVAAEKRAGRPL